MTSLGTVLGVGVLVLVIGLTGSASAQIGERFNMLESTQVTVSLTPDPVREFSPGFPTDVERRVGQVDGVVSAGLTGVLFDGKGRLSTLPPSDTGESMQAPVLAVTGGLFDVARVDMAAGRPWDSFVEETGQRVAVVGPTVADRLGLHEPATRQVIYIGGVPFTVAGVIRQVERRPDLLSAVAIPLSTAAQIWGVEGRPSQTELVVEVRPGAASVVGDQLPIALRPDQPDLYAVSLPPDPASLRENVIGDLSILLLLLAGVSVVVGMVGITNTTFMAVMERTGEIGVRRALGARPGHIAWQFLIEAGLLGLMGGVVGTSAGTVGVVAICVIRQWTAVIPWALSIAGPALGLVTGIVAGLHPARQASRIEPIEALRA